MKNITFINAGAGSGKTYRLTQELYSAIHNGDCKADEVMLTTFTKKAAEEIRVKAREKLLKENLTTDANQLQNAFIGTIHSVGSQIIQKFWHYIGLPKDIKVMGEDDTTFYFNQAIANIPTSKELEIISEINYRFSPRQSNGFYDSDKWKSDLLKIIELARTNNISNFKPSLQESLINTKQLLNTNNNIIDIKVIGIAIKDAITIGNNLPDKKNGGRKNNIKSIRNIDTNRISYTELFKIKTIIDDLIGKEYDEGKLTEASNNLENIQRSENLFKDIKTYNKLIFELAERSIKAYADFKKEIGLIDYADMENSFLRLLDIDDIKAELKKTVKLVLIDEFQDSSPIQLAIFIKLSEIVDKSIWVGDPKQSIFGFRGTDPQLIDTVINEFNHEVGRNLNTDNLPNSWRSRPSIVNLVNKIFVPALKNQVNEDSIALNPIRTDNGFKNNPSIHHFNFIESDKKKENYYHALAKGIVNIINNKWSVSDKNRSIPNKDAKKEIVVTKELKPCDIAILCKTNQAVEEISQQLVAKGIKVASEILGLENTAEYQLIIALIKLLQAKNNTLAKAQIKVLTEDHYLTKELIDDRLEFLHSLPARPTKPEQINFKSNNYFKLAMDVYEDDNKTYYEELNLWGSENFLINNLSIIVSNIKGLPVPQLIEQLINRLNLYTVVAKWGNTEQRRGNLQKIIDYAYKYDERCLNMTLGASITGFVQYFEQQDDKKEAQTNSDDAVNVLTYHKSKGLEWPIVILSEFQKDIDWAFASREVFGIRIQHNANIDLSNILTDRIINLLPWPFGVPQASVSDDFKSHIADQKIYKKAVERHENELKRLMYVGMTRPRDYMVTTGIEGGRNYKWIDMVNANNNWNFAESTNKQEETFVDIFNRGEKSKFHQLQLLNDLTLTEDNQNYYFKDKNIEAIKDQTPYFISPSKVTTNNKITVSLYKDVQNRIPIGASLNDKEDILGNCLHDILYIFISNKKSKINNNIKNTITKIITNHNLNSAINPNDVIKSIEYMYNYINNEFRPIEWYCELPIEVEIEQQLYKGEIDLLLETNSGYILIDYKSFTGNIKYTLDPKRDNYAGKYAGQLNTYTKMIETVKDKKVIKKLIYYTVLGKMVEVEM